MNTAQLLRRFLACALAPLIVSAAACSDGSSNTGAPSHETAGDFSITAEFTPDPPIAGDNVVNIYVEDLDGNAVTDAQITVVPMMPMMGHGSNAVAVVTNEGEGEYSASPVALTMAGEWEVTVSVVAGDDSGELVLKVDIE